MADGTDTSATRDLYQPPSSPDRGAQALVGAALVILAAIVLLGTLRSVAGDERTDFGRQQHEL